MTPLRNLSNSPPVLALTVALLCLPTTLLADARNDAERGIAEYQRGNLIEAIEWLQKSAEAGYAPAQTTLAFILDAAEDDTAAFRWYQAAADQKDAAGLLGLGIMYAKGEGAEKNPEQAGQLIRRAAGMEHPPAMRAYANALEHGELGFTRDPAAAAAWFHKAANLGDEDSMRRLKSAYSLGQLGLEADARRAAEWDAKIKKSN